MHGEQGALVCTAKIVESVPWIDAKYYAATQVMDEARHVEVFARYLDEKLSGHYPINAHLGLLLDDIITDTRWDMTYLGMQIMVEGLALAAFGFIHADDDRAAAQAAAALRHVRRGPSRCLRGAQPEGVLRGAVVRRVPRAPGVRLRGGGADADRFLSKRSGSAWRSPRGDVLAALQAPERDDFQTLLFSKIVPNCKKLGLLDAADGWLREKFTEMGAIAFEDLEPTPTRTKTPSPTAHRPSAVA